MQLSLAELEQNHWRTRSLSRTLFFWIISAAFIAMIVPTLAVYMRGHLGFLLVMGIAVLVGAAERSLGPAIDRISSGIAANKLLAFILVWYVLGAITNLLFRGEGAADWQLMLSPLTLLLGLGFIFAFATDNDCYRIFQIALILSLGIQSVFSTRELSSGVSIAREMWVELQGAWAYGNQRTFAMMAMLLPIFIWRTMIESRYLRLALLLSCAAISAMLLLSSFGTPLFLLIVGVALIIGLLLLFPPLHTPRATSILWAFLLAGLAWTVYQFTADNPFMEPVYYRIENALRDPTSGGYAGTDLQGSRWRLAEVSIASFLREPLFGAGGGSTRHSIFVGGHSSLFDMLGAYGLFGGGGAMIGVITLMLIQAIRHYIRARSWETLVSLAAVVMLTVAGVINPYWEGMEPIYVMFMARSFQWDDGIVILSQAVEQGAPARSSLAESELI